MENTPELDEEGIPINPPKLVRTAKIKKDEDDKNNP